MWLRPKRDAMFQTTKYSATEVLENGRQISIRDLKPDDRDLLLAAVSHASEQSLYRRFFGPRREFSEREIAYFVNVDFVSHVALAAVYEDLGRAVMVGTGRYIVTGPGTAELPLRFSMDSRGKV